MLIGWAANLPTYLTGYSTGNGKKHTYLPKIWGGERKKEAEEEDP